MGAAAGRLRDGLSGSPTQSVYGRHTCMGAYKVPGCALWQRSLGCIREFPLDGRPPSPPPPPLPCSPLSCRQLSQMSIGVEGRHAAATAGQPAPHLPAPVVPSGAEPGPEMQADDVASGGTGQPAPSRSGPFAAAGADPASGQSEPVAAAGPDSGCAFPALPGRGGSSRSSYEPGGPDDPSTWGEVGAYEVAASGVRCPGSCAPFILQRFCMDLPGNTR